METSHRKKLIVANWKMHGRLHANIDFLHQLRQALKPHPAVDYALCLPYPYLFQAQQILENSALAWGAQNVSRYDEGAYTASVSAKMLSDFGCRYALLGHSERRAVTKETNYSAAQRIEHALRAGITPIYCIGETKEERLGGLPNMVVAHQLCAVLDLNDEVYALAKQHQLVIAYEPVWAIGAQVAAWPDQVQSMHQFIRKIIAERDPQFANEVRVIYGGSLNASNAATLLSMPDIDGGLVGRASLNVEEFSRICSYYAIAVPA